MQHICFLDTGQGIIFRLALCFLDISIGQVFKRHKQLCSPRLQSTSVVVIMPGVGRQLLNILFLSLLTGAVFRDREEKCGNRWLIHRFKSSPTISPQVCPGLVNYINSGPHFIF